MLLGYSKSQHNRRKGWEEGQRRNNRRHLRAGRICVFSACAPSGKAVLLHLLIQKHFQYIIYTTLLFFPFQSVPLSWAFMFIFYHIFTLYLAFRRSFFCYILYTVRALLFSRNSNSFAATGALDTSVCYWWFHVSGALLQGLLLICTPGRFFFIITKAADTDSNVPSWAKEAFTGPFLIRIHRRKKKKKYFAGWFL